MRSAPWAAAIVLFFAVVCSARTIVFEENRGNAGVVVEEMTASHIDVSLRLDEMRIDDFDVDGKVMQQISIPGVMLPNDEGAPNLPGIGRFVAIPEGATARLEVLSFSTRVFEDLDVLPAPAIPLDTDSSPPVFEKNPAIYEADALYPAEHVRLSETMDLRGVDAVILGISPFQYNPVTRELIVYTDVTVRVSFEGGNGHFGEDRLRSRHWDPILAGNLLNYGSLPEIDFDRAPARDDEYEYVIIVPDDPTYAAWADSIKQWRTYQGIDTGVVTLAETGATSGEIEEWIDSAYDTWATPPVAVLLLADYAPSGETTGITSPVWKGRCISDNIYGDVDGADDLPDIIMARMTATPDNIEMLVTKAIGYERSPVTNPGFYQNPVLACGWESDRWFTLCVEVIYGFFEDILGKTPVREYAISIGTPGMEWSTNQNTHMVVDYFGRNGLGYIPGTPLHLTDWDGDAARINADINAGAFMMLHRDHGSPEGWEHPHYYIEDLAELSNDDLTFVLSINCLTGRYGAAQECFAEAFHRMEHGALGVIAASEVSYSFVNDTFVFGMYDGMWPVFDPGYGDPGEASLRPGFGSAYGKYYLQVSNWPSNPQHKAYTHHLFHMHGDAFTTLYSEVPQDLTVAHDDDISVGAATFNVTADEGSVIALTLDGAIIGVAEGTGAPVAVSVTPPTEPGQMRLTVTKANHRRFSADVPIVYAVTWEIDPPTIPVQTASDVTVTVWDGEGVLKPDVVVTIDGWGAEEVSGTTDEFGQATLAVTSEYGEDLAVAGRTIGESYDCLGDVLPVTGAATFGSADVEAGVPSIGLSGSLTPHFQGTITGTASETGFTLYAVGCGVDASAVAGGTSVDLLASPDATGTIGTAIGKAGFNVYLEDIPVEIVYGQLAGEIFESGGPLLEGARVRGYAAGADTAASVPLFEDVSGADGTYAIQGDLEVEYYDVYAAKLGYLTGYQEVLLQCGANDVDFFLDAAPAGIVSGTVVEAGTGYPLSATIRVYRADDMALYVETYSDSLAGGAYSVVLPYFDYVMKARATHHLPETMEITVDEPSETFDFTLEPTLGSFLVIGDGGSREGGGIVKVDRAGGATDVASDERLGEAASDEFGSDLEALGYDVTSELAGSSDPATWPDYDLIVWSSGNNMDPVSSADDRTAIEDYVAGGGKLVIEGGEIGFDALLSPGYPSFAANVLHIDAWLNHEGGGVTISDPGHPVACLPNVLGPISVLYSGYGDQDASTPLADAQMVCHWSIYPWLSSVLVYDDNLDPASGQIAYYSFNYAAADPTERLKLIENTVTYLTTPESVPTGSVSGVAMLVGEILHGGVEVTTSPGGDSAYTDPSGAYVIEAVYQGTYTVTATAEGRARGVVEGVVVLEGEQTSGVDFLLDAVELYEYCELPDLAIPDNDPVGVYDSIDFPDDTTISCVEVYVDITHYYIGDLIVELTSPEGTTVRLHDRTDGAGISLIGWYPTDLTVGGPGSLEDLQGESAAGEWEMRVSDNAGGDLGTLNEWCVRVAGYSQTGVDEAGEALLPSRHVLRGASPNPFNPVTTISYGLPDDGPVAIAIYNVAGRLVRVLVDGPADAGYHSAEWDGRDESGATVASGVYFCRMEADGFSDAVKMVLLK